MSRVKTPPATSPGRAEVDLFASSAEKDQTLHHSPSSQRRTHPNRHGPRSSMNVDILVMYNPGGSSNPRQRLSADLRRKTGGPVARPCHSATDTYLKELRHSTSSSAAEFVDHPLENSRRKVTIKGPRSRIIPPPNPWDDGLDVFSREFIITRTSTVEHLHGHSWPGHGKLTRRLKKPYFSSRSPGARYQGKGKVFLHVARAIARTCGTNPR